MHGECCVGMYRVYELPWSLFDLYKTHSACSQVPSGKLFQILKKYSKSNQILKKKPKIEIFKQDFKIEILKHQTSQNKNELNLEKKRIKILKQRSV
jgi:hypothetical protein